MRWLPSDSHECERTFYPYVFLSPLAPREPPFATFFVFLLSCSSHPHTRTHTNSAALPSQHVPRDPLTTEGKRRKTPSPPPFSFFVLLSRRALTQRCRALPLADFSVRQGPMSAWKFGKRGSEKGGKGRCSDELHSFFFFFTPDRAPRVSRGRSQAAQPQPLLLSPSGGRSHRAATSFPISSYSLPYLLLLRVPFLLSRRALSTATTASFPSSRAPSILASFSLLFICFLIWTADFSIPTFRDWCIPRSPIARVPP